MSLRPSSLCDVAATGHTSSHGASSHCWHGTGWLYVFGASRLPSKYVSTRIQCISRCRNTCSLPTTAMLFSDVQAVMHTPQPVHAFKSIAMPHLLPLYLNGGNSERFGGGASPPSSATAFGFARNSSA